MSITIRLFALSFLIFNANPDNGNAQTLPLNRLLTPPLEYIVLKTEEEIFIDGKDNETEWNRAPWTNLFTDIETGEADGNLNGTRAKMLWDNEFLYLYILLEEYDIWASLKERDSSVFQDKALEIFIDPDGDTHNYFEFQINAYGTVWDLFMSKPYRNGGKSLSSWDINGLLIAIDINGTLNNPDDKDISWSIELAIPFTSIKMGGDKKPQDGLVWRMNLSRVDWNLDVINGEYQRQRDKETGKLLSEQYTVWSPQGVVNLHYPERYGFIIFKEKSFPSSGFYSDEIYTSRLLLWKYYYLQQIHQKETGKYAITMSQLNKQFPEQVILEDESKINFYATEYQFRVHTFSSFLNKNIAIDEQGKVHEY